MESDLKVKVALYYELGHFPDVCSTFKKQR